MSRIYVNSTVVVDFCDKCMPDERAAKEKYCETDGFAYDVTHPTYSIGDYRCYVCGKQLTELDD